MADQTLDARGLNCPLPILKARKALSTLPVGGTLEVLATDPGAIQDFAAFSRATGHDILEQSREGNVLRFVLRRSA